MCLQLQWLTAISTTIDFKDVAYFATKGRTTVDITTARPLLANWPEDNSTDYPDESVETVRPTSKTNRTTETTTMEY